MRDFYIDVFGFPLHSESEHEDPEHPIRPGEPTICFLKVASSDTPLGRAVHPPFLVLIDYKRHAGARKRFTHIDQTASSLNHVAFEIPPASYGDWLARLQAKGLDPFETEFPGVEGKALFIKDPEGNSIELICHLV
jgi:catechol 2,3-dioxygenase-like lactoylglutathione lyase family enzyme